MPLRCISGEGDELAFDHDAVSWTDLRERNLRDQHLRFPCCDAGVVLKRSPLGNRYFAHKFRGGCETAPESQEHLRAKTIICKALRAAGWLAIPEHRMADAEGICIADVLGKRASRASKGIAFEVQWSPQSGETTTARTTRYTEHHLRSLWFMKRPVPLNSKEVPVTMLVPSDQGFDVYIPNETLVRGAEYMRAREITDLDTYWRRCGTLADFVRGVVEGRFRFGLPEEFDIRIRITGAANWCYVCGTETKAATSIVLDLGPLNPDFPNILVEIHELGEIDGVLAQRVLDGINARLPECGGYRLEKRKPKASAVAYLANTCTGCGAFLSRSYIPFPSSEDRTLLEFDLTTTAEEVVPFYQPVDRWCFIDGDHPPPKTLVAMHGFPVRTSPYRSEQMADYSADGPLEKVRNLDPWDSAQE